MRHTRPVATILTVLVLATPVVMVGCQSAEESNHDKWVGEANNRWLTLRSSMMLEMAQQQFSTGDLDLAERTVSDAIQLDPRNPALHVLAGRIAIERGELEQAYHLLEQAKKVDEEHAPAYYYQGLVVQRWQRHEEAHQRYQRAYELRPDNVDYLLATAEMLVPLQRLDDAIGMLEDKLDYFPESASLRVALGHFWKMENRPDKAVSYFEQASLMADDDPKLLEELALAQVGAGQPEQAVQTLDELFSRFPEAKERRGLRRVLARAYVEVGRVAQAREIYLELARREQPEAQDWMRLAELAWREGDLAAALQAAQRAMALEPRRQEGYLLAGMVWQKRGEVEQALEMFDRAAELSPSDASPLILRGLTLQRAGRRAAAVEAYQAALERNPSDARAQRLLQGLNEGRPTS